MSGFGSVFANAVDSLLHITNSRSLNQPERRTHPEPLNSEEACPKQLPSVSRGYSGENPAQATFPAFQRDDSGAGDPPEQGGAGDVDPGAVLEPLYLCGGRAAHPAGQLGPGADPRRRHALIQRQVLRVGRVLDVSWAPEPTRDGGTPSYRDRSCGWAGC